MIKRFFIFAFLFVLSGCGSKSMLKLAGAVESLNKDLVEANKVIAKSNTDLSRYTDAIQKLIDVQEKETERKAKEEAKKNRSWLEKLADLG
ncbi:hypothetical protein AGMMS49573_10580 [Endomicrobiia bacterium]|nr:hypothetical protein AGMMS49573_10580 [Endomicrobiia bacterium]